MCRVSSRQSVFLEGVEGGRGEGKSERKGGRTNVVQAASIEEAAKMARAASLYIEEES